MLMPSLRMAAQDGLELALQHGEIAIDDGCIVAAGESRPRVDAHFLADGHAMHGSPCGR